MPAQRGADTAAGVESRAWSVVVVHWRARVAVVRMVVMAIPRVIRSVIIPRVIISIVVVPRIVIPVPRVVISVPRVVVAVVPRVVIAIETVRAVIAETPVVIAPAAVSREPVVRNDDCVPVRIH